ncbi:hypothetical protein [Flavobacterium gelatinilyticum]|uniref:hypothetical protein n=1 Tax=Flavobacterium gelatinilyticum TaxID=3003260 RepID=UPI002481368E|nr:hypothetical protein [Flavobacterium gelatinilyticum]
MAKLSRSHYIFSPTALFSTIGLICLVLINLCVLFFSNQEFYAKKAVAAFLEYETMKGDKSGLMVKVTKDLKHKVFSFLNLRWKKMSIKYKQLTRKNQLSVLEDYYAAFSPELRVCCALDFLSHKNEFSALKYRKLVLYF